MNINVPAFARSHFWEEPPEDSMEFWGFRFQPPCKVGDPLHFRFDGKLVATSRVYAIEAPGQSACDGTGRFGNTYKVFWTNESFKDVRSEVPA